MEDPPYTGDKREAQIHSLNLIPLFPEPRNRRSRAKQVLYLISLLQGTVVKVITLPSLSVSQLLYNIL
jgi:hypothetical protein